MQLPLRSFSSRKLHASSLGLSRVLLSGLFPFSHAAVPEFFSLSEVSRSSFSPPEVSKVCEVSGVSKISEVSKASQISEISQVLTASETDLPPGEA